MKDGTHAARPDLSQKPPKPQQTTKTATMKKLNGVKRIVSAAIRDNASDLNRTHDKENVNTNNMRKDPLMR